jgi:hypothetical protein
LRINGVDTTVITLKDPKWSRSIKNRNREGIISKILLVLGVTPIDGTIKSKAKKIRVLKGYLARQRKESSTTKCNDSKSFLKGFLL